MTDQSAGVLGVIGVGELAEAMITALCAASAVRQLYLSPRGRHISPVGPIGVDRLDTNQAVADSCRQLLIGVRPGQLEELAAELRLSETHEVILLAAGVPHETLERLFQPAKVTRVMTGLAVASGQSAISLFPASERVEALLAPACSDLLVFDQERSFDASILAVCANAWWLAQLDRLIQTLQQESGMPAAQARALMLANHADVTHLMTLWPDLSPARIADRIATPGTYTAMGLQQLEDSGSHDAWCSTLSNILNKLNK